MMSGQSADKRKVLILHGEPKRHVERIRSDFPQLEIACCTNAASTVDMIRRHQPEVVLAFLGYPRSALVGASSIKWIHVAAAGVDHLAPWDKDRLTVTNSSGVHDEALADYAACAMLMFSLGFPRFLRQQARRQWIPHELRPLSGQQAAVIGFGRIGQRIGARAKSLGMQVVGVRTEARPSPSGDRVVGVDQLHSVLSTADFVILTLPRTPRTLGLIDDTAVKAMKAGAYLVNLSRGGIVDEGALLAALQSGHVAGAALDVFQTEPLPETSEFWQLDNVVVTPHTCDIVGWQDKVVDLFCENLRKWMSSKALINVVDPCRGY